MKLIIPEINRPDSFVALEIINNIDEFMLVTLVATMCIIYYCLFVSMVPPRGGGDPSLLGTPHTVCRNTFEI